MPWMERVPVMQKSRTKQVAQTTLFPPLLHRRVKISYIRKMEDIMTYVDEWALTIQNSFLLMVEKGE